MEDSTITKIKEVYKTIDLKNAFIYKEDNDSISIENKWLGLPVVISIKLTANEFPYQGKGTCKIRGNGTVITKSIHNIKDYNEFITRFYKAVIDCRVDNNYYIEERPVISELFDTIYDKIYELQITDDTTKNH
jgi:hypothetical protein